MGNVLGWERVVNLAAQDLLPRRSKGQESESDRQTYKEQLSLTIPCHPFVCERKERNK